MQLQKLHLLNYKNFSEISFDFEAKINCFVGHNGIGKTNILDSIYHLAFGKSYFNAVGSHNIKHDADFFVIDGQFLKSDRTHQIVCSLKRNQKKVLKRDGKLYEKFSEHIGFIPLVIISPSDSDLISEGSEVRRKFIDAIISQLDHHYLNQLIRYQGVVSQRNALLKYFALNHVFEADTLSIYNDQLCELADYIYQIRKEFIQKFTPIFQKYHQFITGAAEPVDLVYQSQLHQDTLANLLQTHLAKDRVVQYTTVGVHKDDLDFLIDHHPIKKFGSQGQQKSFLIALKLAQFEFVSNQNNEKPILLFDDIFDKLDRNRVGKIIDLVNQNTFGQIFISDTDPDRTQMVIEQTNQSYKIFQL